MVMVTEIRLFPSTPVLEKLFQMGIDELDKEWARRHQRKISGSEFGDCPRKAGYLMLHPSERIKFGMWNVVRVGSCYHSYFEKVILTGLRIAVRNQLDSLEGFTEFKIEAEKFLATEWFVSTSDVVAIGEKSVLVYSYKTTRADYFPTAPRAPRIGQRNPSPAHIRQVLTEYAILLEKRPELADREPILKIFYICRDAPTKVHEYTLLGEDLGKLPAIQQELSELKKWYVEKSPDPLKIAIPHIDAQTEKYPCQFGCPVENCPNNLKYPDNLPKIPLTDADLMFGAKPKTEG